MGQGIRAFTSDQDGEDPVNPLSGVVFTLDGEKFSCDGEPDLLDQSELALLASQAVAFDAPEATASVAAFLQMAFGPETYRRFRMHTKRNRTPPETILAIIDMINEELEAVVVAQAGRPTGRRSPSSGGRSETEGQMSKLASWGTGDVVAAGKPKTTKRQDMPSKVVKIGSSKAS